MYGLLISPRAQKQFRKLERHIQECICAVIERVRTRPEHYAEALVGKDAYKIRIGDYRAIIDIDHKQKNILIIKVGHRKTVYDRL